MSGKNKVYRVAIDRSEVPLFEAFLAADYLTPSEFFKNAKDAYCAKATKDPKYGTVWNRFMSGYRTMEQINQDACDYDYEDEEGREPRGPGLPG